jgi:hypothetical protein
MLLLFIIICNLACFLGPFLSIHTILDILGRFLYYFKGFLLIYAVDNSTPSKEEILKT